jgi:hypothetical protein
MTTPRIHHGDMQNLNYKQKDVFTFSVAPVLQHINNKTIPWINYKDMQEMNYKQKDVFTFSVAPDLPHINEDSLENGDDIGKSDSLPCSFDTLKEKKINEIYKRKKTSKLRKRCNLRRKSKEHNNDISKSATKRGSFDTVEIDDLDKTKKRKKRSKFRKKCNLSRKNMLYESYSSDEDHIDFTHGGHEDRFENAHFDQLNKHAAVGKRTMKIPFATFEKIHNFLFPPIINSTIPATKPENNLQIDNVLELEVASESDVQIEDLKEQEVASWAERRQQVEDASHDTKVKRKTIDANEFNRYAGVRSMAMKIPISTCVEIDNFLNYPICGSSTQNTSKFLDPSNKLIPKLDTKLIDIVTFYQEQPYCLLIGFESHEIIYSIDQDHVYHTNTKKRNDNSRSVVIPIHDSHSMKTSKINNKTCPSHEYVNIRVPVVLGEYNIEISLEKDVLFEEKIYKVKEISKEVVLTNCKFVPISFSHSTADYARIANNGKLFIEGYIYQHIEYFAVQNEEKIIPKDFETLFHQLHQKIVLELMVQLLQVQKVTMGHNEK